MNDFHVHCKVCGTPYSSKEDADKCFYTHDEIDVLRCIMCDLYYKLNSDGEFCSKREKRYFRKIQSRFDKLFGGSWMRDEITKVFDYFKIEEPEDYINRR